MTPKAVSILFETVAKAVGDRFDPYRFKPAGPDVYFFPEIDGCYALRRSPKRWSGGQKHILVICGPGGRMLGMHEIYTSIPSAGGDAKEHTQTNVAWKIGGRRDLSLENSVRYCYLSFQENNGADSVYEHTQNESGGGWKRLDHKIEPFIVSEDASYFALITYGEGYSIFDMDGRLIGNLPLGGHAQYYPSDGTVESFKLKMSKSRSDSEKYPRMPWTFLELRPYVDRAFDFIKRCE